jgi:hypothetical protein
MEGFDYQHTVFAHLDETLIRGREFRENKQPIKTRTYLSIKRLIE